MALTLPGTRPIIDAPQHESGHRMRGRLPLAPSFGALLGTPHEAGEPDAMSEESLPPDGTATADDPHQHHLRAHATAH
jgi:hypothetical protein